MATGPIINFDLMTTLIAAAAVPLAAIITWLATRNKNHAEAVTGYAQAAHVSVETMLQVLDQLRDEVDELLAENEKLRKDTNALHGEVEKLKRLILAASGDPSRGRRASDRALRED